MSSSVCTGLALPVTGTVHGLQRKDIFFHGEREHVLAVVLPVPWCLPEFAVIDVGGGYFLEASSPILLLAQQTNISEQWEPEAAQELWAQLSCGRCCSPASCLHPFTLHHQLNAFVNPWPQVCRSDPQVPHRAASVSHSAAQRFGHPWWKPLWLWPDYALQKTPSLFEVISTHTELLQNLSQLGYGHGGALLRTNNAWGAKRFHFCHFWTCKR